MSDSVPKFIEFRAADAAFYLYLGNAHALVTIHPDGRHEFAEGLDLDDTARRFWEYLSQHGLRDDAEVARLRAFKEYVHTRLDEAGVQKNPRGRHAEAGCRIGQRLDLVLTEPPRGENAPDLKTLREALSRMHSVAIGESRDSYMRVPADPKRDADLLLSAALEELAAARKRIAYLEAVTFSSKHGEPELPPLPPDRGGPTLHQLGGELPRYGVRWSSAEHPLAVPMPDGYWTPWHLADEAWRQMARGVSSTLDAAELANTTSRGAIEQRNRVDAQLRASETVAGALREALKRAQGLLIQRPGFVDDELHTWIIRLLKGEMTGVAQREEEARRIETSTLMTDLYSDPAFREGVKRAVAMVRNGPTTTPVDAVPVVRFDKREPT